MADKCPICNSDINAPTYYHDPKTSWSMNSYSCPRCGNFNIEYGFGRQLPYILNNDIQKIAVLSHWVRTQHEAITKEPQDKNFNIKNVSFDEQTVDLIIKNPPPTPAVQADNFIRWMGEKAHGETIDIQPGDEIPILPIIGSATSQEFQIILEYLKRMGFIKGNITTSVDGLIADATLTVEGWQYYEKLKKGTSDSRKAFMAMKYGDAQLNTIVENTFKPAVKQTGFDLFLLYERPKAGLIDDRLRVEIQTSRFLIADLSHNNSGAYWEAGYAEGLGKPVIYTCEKKKFKRLKTHFDTNHHLTILWDAENPKEAAEKLKATIRATLPDAAKLTDD
ncbi:MAG: hypothetical protein ABII09_05190 [Planctomycetota bacterium]